MQEIQGTPLPAVGGRDSFTSSTGKRLTVLYHRSGRREVFVEEPGDPDASRPVLDLDERDGRILGELLGGSGVVPDVERLQQGIGGVTLDWLSVEAVAAAAGRTIGELALRQTTGATIVSILRGDQQLPNPGPEMGLEVGDIAVVVGSADACRRARDLFRAS